MEAYFLSSVILFKKWARNLWQESGNAKSEENNQVSCGNMKAKNRAKENLS